MALQLEHFDQRPSGTALLLEASVRIFEGTSLWNQLKVMIYA
jgi:hypothetical protein